MIKNFEEVKKQLGELSDLLNKFKSEQVQLRIVELVFRGTGTPHEVPEEAPPSTGKSARRRRRASRGSGSASDENGGGKKRVRAGTGAAPTLDELIGRGYFAKPRTIGAIVEYSRDSLVRIMKPNDFSGPLGRFVRDGKLSRSKNADGQFEYVKK